MTKHVCKRPEMMKELNPIRGYHSNRRRCAKYVGFSGWMVHCCPLPCHVLLVNVDVDRTGRFFILYIQKLTYNG